MTLLRLFFGIFVFVVFLYFVDLKEFINNFTFSFSIFLYTSLAATIFIFFQSLRLHILIKNNVDNLATTIKIGFIGHFFRIFYHQE